MQKHGQDYLFWLLSCFFVGKHFCLNRLSQLQILLSSHNALNYCSFLVFCYAYACECSVWPCCLGRCVITGWNSEHICFLNSNNFCVVMHRHGFFFFLKKWRRYQESLCFIYSFVSVVELLWFHPPVEICAFIFSEIIRFALIITTVSILLPYECCLN